MKMLIIIISDILLIKIKQNFFLESDLTFWLLGEPSTTFRTEDKLDSAVKTNCLSIAGFCEYLFTL